MASPSGIQDPLTINYARQARLVFSQIPSTSIFHQSLSENCSNAELLNLLSRLLATPALTLIVAAAFRPLLLDLCARWLSTDDAQNSDDQLFALALLIQPHEELFPALFRLLQKPVFVHGPLAFVGNGQSLSPLSLDVPRLHKMLLSYYRILEANRQLPQDLQWSLAPLSTLIWTPHLDNGVRLLSIRSYALQSGMGEAERIKLEREVLGETCGVDCQVAYEWDPEGNKRDVDGWILPMVEVTRTMEARRALAEPADFYSVECDEVLPPVLETDLSPFIANVHGILLLRTPNATRTATSLISTETTVQCLRNLAVQYSLRLPTLLTSPPSSGKSMLLSHLAGLLHPQSQNQLITIHLADTSLDPRSLLGSYVSSTTQPGTFEWKEGVLVRAMREGKWVVFEDIDRGSNEVLGVLKPLVESLRAGKWIGGRASLEVPSRGRVVAHNEFTLFATRSLQPSRNSVFPPPIFFGAHKFHEIIVPSPTPAELQIIIDARYPRLTGPAAHAAIRLWDDIKALGPAASTRDVGLRELEKFCHRLENLLPSSYQSMDIDDDDGLSFAAIFPNTTLRENMFLEARDVFFGAGTMTASAQAHAEVIAVLVGDHFALEPDRRASVLGRSAEFNIEKDVNGRTLAVRVGRVRLTAKVTKETMTVPSASRPFAMHKPAVSLLSRIATAVSLSEPVLLTGETGTGKTSVITHLASLLRRPLVSLNLSHQTESSDLLGGFKPVDARIPGAQLQERFLELFGATFSRRKNAKFEESVRKSVSESKWKRTVGLWKESTRLAKDRINARQTEEQANDEPTRGSDTQTPRKRRKVDQDTLKVSEATWSAFERDVDEFEVQHVHGKGKFAFGFVEGPLVKALRAGDWVLLDEVNLASPETLECISSLLHGPTASLTLTEQGSLEPVPRHPDFRLFACMNPATDVGKKDLPPNIRARFTEIDVPPPDADRDTLLAIIHQYIGPSAVGDKAAVMNVAEFYSKVKEQAEKREIADGSNHKPHFSMRTLARALTFAADMASTYSLRRSIWEGCLMAFTMVLDSPSAEIVTALAHKHLLYGVRNPRSLLAKDPSIPPSRTADEFVKFGPFHLERGPLPQDLVEDYIMTPSVEAKLIDLARIILTRRFPVLIEGPTSSGKTSSIEYLARRTGHRFIRINNHEHTDIQEYLGSYVSDPLTGKLVFKDGLLVRALRNGDWIVLDELNLAPTDVLEALNRLLDDNRELIIPETHEVVKPHAHFMLFATQNPPGLYAGRKVLSRAFRNRFLEVHFEDVPQTELETILCQRCRIAPSYGARIVEVFHELQKRRQSGRVFESKHGFATLRDLFRWAGRDAVGYQELAENGYMLLAERARRDEDKKAVKEVIEAVMKVKIDEGTMYNLHNVETDLAAFLGAPLPTSTQLVWTSAMQRLYILLGRALRFNEPVLLVGETGSGKTSVCQVYAEAVFKHLHGLNCHQNTETADLIGGLRPIRNRGSTDSEVVQEVVNVLSVHLGMAVVEREPHTLLSLLDASLKDTLGESRYVLDEARRKLVRLKSIFEWHDGPLVHAMRAGDVFLLDEISLADDSVLERLNSVLEPARTIVLAERGGDDSENPTIRAVDDFKLVATMNPGGDYGKKELSPALRNRFTEIWVPAVDNRRDLELIVNSLWKHDALKVYTSRLLDFVEWLCTRVSDRSLLSLRDILAWITFSNSTYTEENDSPIPPNEIFHHAAHMTFLDGLGSLPQLSSYSADALRKLKVDALTRLDELAPSTDSLAFIAAYDPKTFVQLGSFAIPRGNRELSAHAFNITAPTTQDNAMRVVRACQVTKPILLEGSPGVGKTSLIAALANIAGHELCRINLSDQTDLIDLFGSDLPVEGGGPGEFAWKDAEFLKALQEGHWVLLDEMNLAPQAVLEGLNAVLDHRGTVYIPELGKSFTRHPAFRIFAAQNPLNQGGGRKGLPKSFVNRFTKVYVDELSPHDLLLVCRHLFPSTEVQILQEMITFNTRLNEEITVKRSFARDGGPWEFNLRDVIRWGTLISAKDPPLHPAEYLGSIYLHRFRSSRDRTLARALFDEIFDIATTKDASPYPSITSSVVQFGRFRQTRRNRASLDRPGRLLHSQLAAFESIGHCVSQGWLAIITGQHDTGKTEVVRMLAAYTGNQLDEISVNSATDTMDILGSYEQVDFHGHVSVLVTEVLSMVADHVRFVQGSKLTHSTEYQTLLEAKHAPATGIASSVLRSASRILSGLSNVHHETLVDIQLRIDSLLLQDTRGRFEWVDGPLIRAMRHGHWVLMDGANLCTPSVLDRLNSVCEPEGVLTLSEKGYVDGQVQTIKPHPNFRMFMTVNPQHGELSRAMRNRGIEFSLLSTPTSDDRMKILDHLRLPIASSAAEFDLVRRGVISLSGSSSTGLQWSSVRPLDQDSSLSTLLDHASLLPAASSHPRLSSGAISHFLARTIPPAYINHMSRWMEHMDLPNGSPSDKLHNDVRACLSAQVAMVSERVRTAYTQAQSFPADFILCQPRDFFLNPQLCSDSSIERGCSPAHRMLLKLLELSVGMVITEEHGTEVHDTAFQKKLKGSVHVNVHEDVLKKAVAVLNEVQSTGSRILETFDSLGQAELDLCSRLMQYTRHLRAVIVRTPLDFSAVQAISGWIVADLQECTPIFSTVWKQAVIFEDTVALSSGLGLIDIWSALLIDRPLITSLSELQRIDSLASDLRYTSSTRDIRRQVFVLLSLRTLPAWPTEEHADSLAELTARLDTLLIRETQEDQLPLVHAKGPSSLIAELGILSVSCGFAGAYPSNVESYISLIERVIESNCVDTKESILRLVPYQHMLWALSASRSYVAIFAQTQIQWLEALWNTPIAEGIAHGPSMLLHPTQLHSTMSMFNWNQHSLSSLSGYESTIRRQAQLGFMQCEWRLERSEQLIALLLQSMLMLASCFSTSFDGSILKQFQDFDTSRQPTAASVAHLLLLLEQTSNAHFSNSVRLHLQPSLLRLFESNTTHATLSTNLGLCWISISRAILDLYVPNAPVDPAAVQNCGFDLWKQERELLSAQVELHSQLESRQTGNSSNAVLVYLHERLAEVDGHLANAPALPMRYDVSRLHMFWSEVLQFQTQVASAAKIDELLVSLQSRDEAATMREQVIQQSIAGFARRLETAYTEYADIGTPLRLALSYMRQGLRFVAHSVATASGVSDAVVRTVNALVLFPSICSSDILRQDGYNGSSGISAFRHLLLNLAAISLEINLGTHIASHIDHIEIIYQQIIRLRLIDHAKEAELEQVQESLYRRKRLDYDDIGEAEMEEREFLALFPSFDDALDQAPGHPDSSTTDAYTPLIDPSYIQQLVEIHRNLVMPANDASSIAARAFKSARKDALDTLLKSHASTLPDTIDSTSRTFQFELLHECLSSLDGVSRRHGAPYDFYADANVVEAKKASIVLEALRLRLKQLIVEWPDQMVLQNLMDRCATALALDLHSPIAKILAALEQLLVQSDDWETYANKQNTLKTHQIAITTLIVDWRRLELSCWKVLLESQAETFGQGSSDWWFRLYDSTVRGPLDASGRDEREGTDTLTGYLSSLIPLLDDFVTSSPLGQFQTRMDLLQSFETYIMYLITSKKGPEQCALQRAYRILHATRRFYNLFSTQLLSHLAAQRAPLEKEIRDFIKLATWKDINVHALKASAQRTHHRLYKTIRKFRDVLRQPIAERLQPGFAGEAEAHLSDYGDSSPFKAAIVDPVFPPTCTPTLPEHLVNLNRTFKRFSGIVSSRIQYFITNHSAHIIEAFAVDIISSSRDLAALSIPKDIPTEKRTKQQKALLVRKRKAWSDLLKELKRGGFAVNVKPEVLKQQRDIRWIKEQCVMTFSNTTAASPAEKGEVYFNRLHASLPVLRESLANHHSDVTTRELHRGVMLLESNFSMALDARARLVNNMKPYESLLRLSRRLKTVSSSLKIIYAGHDLTACLSHVKETLFKLAHASADVSRALNTYNALQPIRKPADEVLEGVAGLETATMLLCDPLATVVENVHLTKLPLILEDEYILVLQVVEHFAKTSTSLQQWAAAEPCLSHIFQPVKTWLDEQQISAFSLPVMDHIPSFIAHNQSDSLIDSLLVNVQSMLARCPDTTEEDTGSEKDHYIRNDYRSVREFSQLLEMENILERIEQSLVHFSVMSSDDLRNNLQRLLPFMDVYIETVSAQIQSHAEWTKSLFKLAYILCSVMHTLAKQGFCQPPDEDESGKGDTTDSAGGVGLGDGAGTENVSKDIEDESQVEGLQGQDKEDETDDPPDRDGDDDAIEMTEDFGGEMEDVPDASDDEDEAGSDDQSDGDPEEQIGDLDPCDPSAVDEKLWGDEEGPDGADEKDEKTNKDHSDSKNNESDVVAKEGASSTQQKSENDKGDKEPEQEPEHPDKVDDITPEEPDEQQDGDPADANGAPMDEHVPEANTLDLPDDLNLDLGEGENKNEDDQDMSMDEDDGVQEEDSPMDNDHSEENTTDDNTDKEIPPEDLSNEGEPDSLPEAQDQPGNESVTEPDQHEDHEDSAIAQPDISTGDGASAQNEPQNADPGESTTEGQTGGAQGVAGQDISAIQQMEDDSGTPDTNNPQESAESEMAGTATAGLQPGQASSQTEQPKQASNPMRSLGDALKEIKQRFDEILDANTSEDLAERTDDPSGAAPAQVEHVRPDDDADTEMQALGSAGEEQVAKLNELTISDEETSEVATRMDVDEPSKATETHERPTDERTPFNAAESLPNSLDDDLQGAITSLDANTTADHLQDDDFVPLNADDVDMTDDHDLELELTEWQTTGFPKDGAEHIWRRYESLTHDLAYALCEQLRLILEPTLATRLKGDYRTGKRLNMKKIISYIASDYTKDKIWLRRTRPSQREYQVLIAIDDSRSMAESHSVHLAFETLALVSKALSRLEAGDVAIAKFGKSVDILHGFDEGPFTDQAGTKVVNAFKFNQEATNVLSLVDTTLRVLETARERRSMGSASAADLWQLEIIISDGICQDHDRLRTVLRKAEEQRVMIVFIIVDSLHAAPVNSSKPNAAGLTSKNSVDHSILSMTNARLKNVGGRMELETERYLDSFPFEYYVVLRDVEALPEVLSGTLKQFFERISED